MIYGKGQGCIQGRGKEGTPPFPKIYWVKKFPPKYKRAGKKRGWVIEREREGEQEREREKKSEV